MRNNFLSQYRDQKHNHPHTILIAHVLYKMKTIIINNIHFPKLVKWYYIMYIKSKKRKLGRSKCIGISLLQDSFQSHTSAKQFISISKRNGILQQHRLNIAYKNLLETNIIWHRKNGYYIQLLSETQKAFTSKKA